jgi:hypothetical protein
MRDKCNLENPRCRIYLNDLIEDQTHECSNTVRCAQCDDPHHSLSSECEKLIQYRSDLKEQVNNAISTGKLHRLPSKKCSSKKNGKERVLKKNCQRLTLSA